MSVPHVSRRLEDSSMVTWEGREERTSGNSPSKRPSPSSALDGWQYQLRSFILNRPSFSVTSVGVMAVRG